MPRFTDMLAAGMRERGHKTEIWMPLQHVSRLSMPQKLKKWAGYIDQYILFPKVVRNKIRSYSGDTLFVFTDHALGPWVPLLKNRFHVIHCHDFLAQCSALGEISENPTAWTGVKYQAFIRRGYAQGKNFISVGIFTVLSLYKKCVPK